MFTKISLQQLIDMTKNDINNLYIAASQSSYRRPMIYLHWSAGPYGIFFGDYDINIDHDGSIYVPDLVLSDPDSHTWRRNAGAVGIAIAACKDAVCNADATHFTDIDFGEYPPTHHQIETMAKCVAVVCSTLGIPVTFEYVRTHAEQATIDGYGIGSGDDSIRWDLLFLPMPNEGSKSGGDIIRGKANWYLQNGITA